MCTISLIPHQTGLRIVCNRDERRSRPLAEPPAVRLTGGVRALWPLDPRSGGTWIGANEAGLAMVIMNRNPRVPPPVPPRPPSRGTIVPELLRCTDLRSVLEAASSLALDRFEPFTLVVVHRGRVATIRNRRTRLDSRTSRLDGPMFFTSSSLGDHLVVPARRALFTRMVCLSPSPLRAQAAFHRHRWAGRPEISVCMSRRDASTVSRTVLDVGSTVVRMAYVPLSGGGSCDPVRSSLPVSRP